MNASQVRRCVLYARLSVSKDESVSIDRQLISARKYAEGRGWEIIGEFVDDGVSATENRPEDRKGWKALLAADGFDAVVIWKVDRLARRVLDFLHVDEVLQQRGAGLVAVEDPIDMTTPMGRAFATILAVFGEMEAAAIGSRISAARAHLVQVGRFVGGGIPYGYCSASNPAGPGRILVQDPECIRWLIDMVRLAQQRTTVTAITTWLDRQQAPLPSSARPRLNGDGWNRQTVQSLLRNPILAGMTPRNPGRKRGDSRSIDPFAVVRHADGTPVIDESLAIITLDEFTELVKALDSLTSPQACKRNERETTSPFLSRVARCDDCGVYMCRGTNQKRPVIYCPKCKQTQSRETLDPYLVRRLLRERGRDLIGDVTVRERWNRAGTDEVARREVLLSQLESLRIRRGVVGRYFDKDRVLLCWRPSGVVAEEAAADA